MPLHDWECHSKVWLTEATCGHVWEVEKRITEPGPTQCPSCKGTDIQQVFLKPTRFKEMTPKSIVVRDPPKRFFPGDKRRKPGAPSRQVRKV